jgi:hypothetical protein
VEEIYGLHAQLIKTKLKNNKITLIIDESPDLLVRCAVNTLVDTDNKTKSVSLIDTSILGKCNSSSIAILTTKVLNDYGKEWSNLIGIASDSAPYMKKNMSRT